MEVLVCVERSGVLALHALEERPVLGMLGVPPGDQLDKPPALPLRFLTGGHGALPLVACDGGQGSDRRHAATQREDAVTQPAGVTILEVGEAPQGLAHLRVACVGRMLAQARRVLGLAAIRFEQVCHQIVAAIGGAQATGFPSAAGS